MKIAMLGADGVTGTAVVNKIKKMKGHEIVPVEEADIIVTSPGIPPAQFPQTDKEVISEIELAWRLLQKCKKPPQIIGITGTNGKTTVTTMIGLFLDCPTAGNIGSPLISFVPETPEQEKQLPKYLAVELSSYQLETTATLHPVVAINTNITEDHITRHKTMEAYATAKARIFRMQTAKDLFIYNVTDTYMQKLLPSCKAQKMAFDIKEDKYRLRDHMHIPGDHNVENAICATYAALFLGVPIETIYKKLESFAGVEHRIEYTDTIKGIKCYNDSKGTNPDSTVIAIRALGAGGTIILGGRDKLTSLDEMCMTIKDNISRAILIGEAADRFQTELTKCGFTNITKAADMKDAIEKALAQANEDKYLLLSPACASFDMYKNYEERGRDFKKIIKEIAHG